MQQGLGSEGAGSAQPDDLKGDFTSLGPWFLIRQLPPGTLGGLSQVHRHRAVPASALSCCPWPSPQPSPWLTSVLQGI